MQSIDIARTKATKYLTVYISIFMFLLGYGFF